MALQTEIYTYGYPRAEDVKNDQNLQHKSIMCENLASKPIGHENRRLKKDFTVFCTPKSETCTDHNIGVTGKICIYAWSPTKNGTQNNARIRIIG